MSATPTLPVETAVPADGVPPPAAGWPPDRYTLGDEIARGGMGVVVAARDAHLNRDVAVKLLRPEYRLRPGAVRRFLDEGRVTGQLQHPGVPPVHDLGARPDGSPFLAMKLIRGRTLAALFAARTDAPAERSRLLAVVEQVAQTLAYAHSKGVIHRDLKPGNVMVGAFGEVQVMDWGLAKLLTAVSREAESSEPSADPHPTAVYNPPSALDLPDADDKTQAGAMLGTPAYMPPEQAAGALDRIDRRADVFALGAVLGELLTGQPPYVGETTEKTKALAMLGHLQPAYDRLAACGADAELIGLARRCLSADPADRPADAQAVADALTGHRAGVEAKLRAAEVSAAEARVRRRLRTRLAAAVMLALAAGGAAAGWQWRQAEKARQAVVDEEAKVRRALGETEAERERVAVALGRERQTLGRLLESLRMQFQRVRDKAGNTYGDDDRFVLLRELANLCRLWELAVADTPAGPEADRLQVEPSRWSGAVRLQVDRPVEASKHYARAIELWRRVLPDRLADPVERRRYADDLFGLAAAIHRSQYDPEWYTVALPDSEDDDQAMWAIAANWETIGSAMRSPAAAAAGNAVVFAASAALGVPSVLDGPFAAVAGAAAAVDHQQRPSAQERGMALASVAGPLAVAAHCKIRDYAGRATVERSLAECLDTRRKLFGLTADRDDHVAVADTLALLAETSITVDPERWDIAELAERLKLTSPGTKEDWFARLGCRARMMGRLREQRRYAESAAQAAAAVEDIRHVMLQFGDDERKRCHAVFAEIAKSYLATGDHHKAAEAANDYWATAGFMLLLDYQHVIDWLVTCRQLALADERLEPIARGRFAADYTRRAVGIVEGLADNRSGDKREWRAVLASRRFDPIRSTPEFRRLVERLTPPELAPPPRPAK